MMSFGKDKLVATRDDAIEMEGKLQDLIADMDDIESNDQYNILMSLIESDPDLIADFISSPVNLDQEPIYAMANNGSATAPFYVILSIWFGALILIAIMHTGLKTNPGCRNLRNWQKFFGRYIVFYLMGQLQTIITVLGCILYVGIQCDHPLMFWFAGIIYHVLPLPSLCTLWHMPLAMSARQQQSCLWLSRLLEVVVPSR